MTSRPLLLCAILCVLAGCVAPTDTPAPAADVPEPVSLEIQLLDALATWAGWQEKALNTEGMYLYTLAIETVGYCNDECQAIPDSMHALADGFGIAAETFRRGANNPGSADWVTVRAQAEELAQNFNTIASEAERNAAIMRGNAQAATNTRIARQHAELAASEYESAARAALFATDLHVRLYNTTP